MIIKDVLSPKILIADNKLLFCETLKIMLTEEGYLVEEAHSVKEAIDKISQISIHCILLDLSFLDNPYFLDGIEVLEFLKTKTNKIPVITMSQFLSIDTISALHENYSNMIGCVNKRKQDCQERILELIRKALFESNEINWDLDIQFHNGVSLDKLIESLKEVNVDSLEILELIGKAFKKNPKVDLFPLTPGFSGTGVVRAVPHVKTTSDRSIIGETEVFKFGSLIKISKEEKNFKLFVEPLTKDHRRTSLIEEATYTRQLGSLRYGLIGASSEKVICFSEFYRKTENIGLIKNILEDLFNVTCSIWYADKEREFINPQEEYDTEKLKERLKSWISQNEPILLESPLIPFPELSLSLKNPFLILSQLDDKSYQGYKSITHGDLNGSNILIYQKKQESWLIDFYQTGHKHILTDFIKLETVIKFELLENWNLKALYEAEKCCMFQDDLRSPIEFPNGSLPIEIEKMLQTVNLIRKLASEYSGQLFEDASYYYLSLFYQTARALTYDSIKSDTKRYILLSLCLLGEKLVNTN